MPAATTRAAPAEVPAPEADLIFDVTDLLGYFRHARTVTGIQRVVLCLALPALRRGAAAAVFDAGPDVWRTVPTALVERLWTLSGRAGSAEPDWVALAGDLAHAREAGAPMAFGRRSLLVALGANWGEPRIFCALRQLREQWGVRTAAFVHDVVPLLYPEHCQEETRGRFGHWFASTLTQADALVVNSRTTADDLLRIARRLGLPAQPPIVCPLNGRFPVGPRGTEGRLDPEVVDVVRTPFVLFVGTLEPRKNHVFVLAAWRAAMERLDPVRVPNLVLVGKRGWDYAPAVTALSGHGLRDKVRILDSVDDEALGHLYERCLFTIYNSLYEGWGLPVTESLAHGRIPLVPRHSALTESGGEGAEFFEPGSQADFLEKFLRLVTDEAYRRAREDRLAETSGLRDWAEVSRALCADLHRAALARLPVLPTLEPGRILHVRRHDWDGDLAAYALGEGVRGAGWHDLEEWGCWTAAAAFQIAFRYGTPADPDGVPGVTEAIVVHLLLQGNAAGADLSVYVNAARGDGIVPVPGGRRQVVQMRLHAAPGQDVRITIRQSRVEDLSERSGGLDRRTIGVGLQAIMACAETDWTARLNFLEFRAGYRSIAV